MSPPTAYQRQVNSLSGALGPASSARWPNTLKITGAPYSLAAQPLYYSPKNGFYVTSGDVPAAMGSVNFSNFGFGRKRRRGSMCSRRSKRKYNPRLHLINAIKAKDKKQLAISLDNFDQSEGWNGYKHPLYKKGLKILNSLSKRRRSMRSRRSRRGSKRSRRGLKKRGSRRKKGLRSKGR